jgi:hypothetical protein
MRWHDHLELGVAEAAPKEGAAWPEVDTKKAPEHPLEPTTPMSAEKRATLPLVGSVASLVVMKHRARTAAWTRRYRVSELR